MPRLPILFLLLALLAARTPAGSSLLHLAADLLSSDPPVSLTVGSEAPSEPSPDSGWEMDPNG